MKNKGFTLVEVLVAIILVGLAVTALLATNRALTRSNSAGLRLSTAEFLIEQIKELTALLPVVDPESDDDVFGPEPDEASLAEYDDLDDFYNASFSPPIDANSQLLNNFSDYRQQVTVQKVSASDFLTYDPNSPVVRVKVQVYLNSKLISEQNWIRTWY